MNYFIRLITFAYTLGLFITGCKQQTRSVSAHNYDSILTVEHSMKDRSRISVNKTEANDTASPAYVQSLDTSITYVSKEILKILQAKDYHSLAEFVYPQQRLIFSPYAYISTKQTVSFSATQLRNINRQKIYHWGDYDGSVKPIQLTIDQYFDKFVYDADYLGTATKSVNEVQRRGNTIDNRSEVFPGSDFVDYHISGIDPTYRGMDWVTLRLVFEKKDGVYFLLCIVHDSWTI